MRGYNVAIHTAPLTAVLTTAAGTYAYSECHDVAIIYSYLLFHCTVNVNVKSERWNALEFLRCGDSVNSQSRAIFSSMLAVLSTSTYGIDYI